MQLSSPMIVMNTRSQQLDGLRSGNVGAGLVSGLVTLVAQALHLGDARAEDHLDYRYGNYGEESGRIQIQTHSALFEVRLNNAASARGEFVYDAISGATPTGSPPPGTTPFNGPPGPGSSQVPLAHMTDTRWAGNLATPIVWGNNITTPGFAYSLEGDYESIGISLTHSLAFNQKNSTLTFGVSHDFDTIFEKFFIQDKKKDNTDFLIGFSQILGPRTLVSANLTLGGATGYLSDPYRGFHFDYYPDPNALFPEKRPDWKLKEVFLLALNQHVDPLDGSAEISYRFYHDSYGIFAHTASLAWFQKLGKHVIISPTFRYYWQTAASFYAPWLPGDPTVPPSDPYFSGVYIPDYYSADYRLSRLMTFTYGVNATVLIASHVTLDASYQRYEMHGLDSITSPSAYPKANVFSIGARITF
jgi:hypothetical protein